MWRSKKFIVIASLVVVLIAGSIGGVAFAQTSNNDDSSAKAKFDEQWNKVCQIYEDNTGVAIDADQLKAAFEQARTEMQEEALDNQLQKLVDDGKLTEDQADQYKEWLESRPNVNIPFGHGMGGPRMHRGFCGPPPAPPAETE